MKSTLLVLALLVTLSCSAQTSPERARFSSGDPALRLTESDETGRKGYLTVWMGRVVLTGMLVIEFDRGPDGKDPTYPEGRAFFEPDSKSQAKLPAATSFYPAPVLVLWLTDKPAPLLRPLIGKQAFRRVVAGALARYEYPAKVEISSFSTSIDCDHRSYSAEVVRTRLLPVKRLALAESKNLGC